MAKSHGGELFWITSFMEQSSVTMRAPGISTASKEHDLLSFLATAQALKLEFLPITWQSARNGIGTGATAAVNEAFADLHTSFAFKRVQDAVKQDEKSGDIFQFLTNEIMVLSCSPMRNNPYISQLQGLCWDIEADGKVWPALLFEKSHYGDLHNFLRTAEGKNLDPSSRLNMCVDVGKAVLNMHSNNVIHGDLKPQNVLVHKDGTGMYRVKVIDFGFSTRHTNDEPSIRVPISSPWNAPEHDRSGRMWRPSEARRLDYYSVGIMCLWILFEKDFDKDEEELNKVLSPMRSDKILQSFAQNRLDINQTFSDETKSGLQGLFNSTLDLDPEKRRLSFKGFLDEQMEGCDLSEHLQETEMNISDADFKIEASIGELYTCDYRVRSYITNCLQKRLTSPSRSTDASSTAKIAFQVALCYKLGFGTARDEARSVETVQLSNQDSVDTRRLMTYWETMEDSRFRAPCLMRMRDNAHLQFINFGDYYLEHEIVTEAVAQLIQDIANLEMTLGKDHDILIFLKNTLSGLYQAQGRWKDGEKLLQEALNASTSLRDKRDSSTLVLMSRLASMLKSQQHLVEAESIEKEVMDGFTEINGPMHASTLTSISNLTATYALQGRFHEAREQEKRVVRAKSKTLGEEHPSTLLSVQNLTILSYSQGLWRTAKNLAKDACETSAKVYGLQHIHTAQCECRLAACLLELGKVKTAKSKLKRSICTIERVYGVQDYRTLPARCTLASVADSKGEWEKARKLRIKILEISTKVLGIEHPETLTHTNNLATSLQKQDRLEEAEMLLSRVLKTSVERFGQESIKTLPIMANLASVIREQGRWEHSETLGKQVLEISSRTLGRENLFTMEYEADLALTMCSQGHLKKGEGMFRRILEGRSKKLGNKHPATITTLMDLGSALWKLGEFDEAEDCFRKVTTARETMLGAGHPDTLTALAKLALTFWKQERLEDAEDMAFRVVQTRKRVLGTQHPMTLKSSLNLAEMRWQRGGHDEAIKSVESLIKLSAEVKHPLTLVATRVLERWKTTQRIAAEEATL